jgi:hypothetical protein
MSRLAKAIEILEAINNHFQEGADCVYRDGLILSDNTPLGEAIEDCLGDEPLTVPVPHSKRPRVEQNFYGHWFCFIGKRKVTGFGYDKEAALAWLHQQENIIFNTGENNGKQV